MVELAYQRGRRIVADAHQAVVGGVELGDVGHPLIDRLAVDGDVAAEQADLAVGQHQLRAAEDVDLREFSRT